MAKIAAGIEDATEEYASSWSFGRLAAVYLEHTTAALEADREAMRVKRELYLRPTEA